MIEVSHLTKRYGDKYAVDDISFKVNEGEIVGFLGPNGAGKTTTMNIITGYLSSNEGSVTVNGYNVLDYPNQAKKCIGFLPEQPPLYMDMTVREYLNFAYNLKGCKLPKEAHLNEICELVKINHVANRIIKNLSKGYKQRVGIAQALVGNPSVLILDEPTVGLDPKQIIEIRTLIKHLSKGHTVILSSHILPEVQSVCERIIIINKGIIVADDTAVNLSTQLLKEHRLVARIAGPEETVHRAIAGISGIKQVLSLGPKEPGSFDFQIEAESGKDVRKPLFSLLADRRWPLLMLDSGEMTLEDIFLRLTSEDYTARVRSSKKQAKADVSREKYKPIVDDDALEAGDAERLNEEEKIEAFAKELGENMKPSESDAGEDREGEE